MSKKQENKAKEEKPKKEKKSRNFSVVKPFRDVVSGDFLGKGVVERNLPFLGFVTALMLGYIGYQYYADNTVREQVKVEKESAELYSRLQSVKELFNEHSLQSKVAEGTKEIGMYESVDPPVAIKVENGSIEEK